TVVTSAQEDETRQAQPAASTGRRMSRTPTNPMRDRSPVLRPRSPSTSPATRTPKSTPRVGTILPPRVPGSNLPAHNRRSPVLGTMTFPAETDPWGRRAGSPTPDVPPHPTAGGAFRRSEEHTFELQSRFDLVCRLLLD